MIAGVTRYDDQNLIYSKIDKYHSYLEFFISYFSSVNHLLARASSQLILSFLKQIIFNINLLASSLTFFHFVCMNFTSQSQMDSLIMLGSND